MSAEEAPILGFRHLSSERYDYRFDCPIGAWTARLDGKAWGKKKGTLLLYFSEQGTDALYATSVYWTNGFGPECGVINFRDNAEQGEVFELETEKTSTGSVKLVRATKIQGQVNKATSSD